MNEVDWLRRTGELPTDKEYKKLVVIVILELMIPSLFMLTWGMLLFVFAIMQNGIMTLISSIMIFVGGIALIIMAEYIQDEHMGKIKLYKHYKKHPEDFEPRESADK